jgi:hypothetical protein
MQKLVYFPPFIKRFRDIYIYIIGSYRKPVVVFLVKSLQLQLRFGNFLSFKMLFRYISKVKYMKSGFYFILFKRIGVMLLRG